MSLHSNNDIVGLKRFLKRRFLANPDIAKEYRHPTVAEAYRPGIKLLKLKSIKRYCRVMNSGEPTVYVGVIFIITLTATSRADVRLTVIVESV